MSVKQLNRARDERGFSLIEILIGMPVLSVALLGLSAAGGVAARQVYTGHRACCLHLIQRGRFSPTAALTSCITRGLTAATV